MHEQFKVKKHPFLVDKKRPCEQDLCGRFRYCVCGEVKGHVNHPDFNYDHDEMLHAQDSE